MPAPQIASTLPRLHVVQMTTTNQSGVEGEKDRGMAPLGTKVGLGYFEQSDHRSVRNVSGVKDNPVKLPKESSGDGKTEK
jgi:hypothetical protein